MTSVTVKRRPIRAVLYALAGVPCALFATFVFYASRSDQTITAHINNLIVGMLFFSLAIYLYWRSWLNFAGTWESHSVNFNSPLGKTIAASALGAKGVSDLHILYSHPFVAWIGFGLCTLAPIVVWLKTKDSEK